VHNIQPTTTSKDNAMQQVATILTAAVLLIHVYIFLLETVLFRTRGRKVFGLTAEKAEMMAPAMSNQGCYNGFLAAALAVGLLHPVPATATAFIVFGLACVAIAGIWGAVTVQRRILFVQTVPALLALAALWLAR
jgi:putative membrane protein